MSPKQKKEMVAGAAIPNWHIKCDYVEACNCEYGCPCNFIGFPTYGFCRGLVGFRIKEGNYGPLNIDNLDVIYAASWPKAIHEGNGTMQLFIAKGANKKQREALVRIFSGQAKGEGPFALFASTLKYVLEPQFVDIDMVMDGRSSRFSVPGVLEVAIEGFRNPVTGAEQDVRMQLPKGFIWKLAYAAKSKVMRILSLNFNFDDSGKNAYFANVEFRGP